MTLSRKATAACSGVLEAADQATVLPGIVAAVFTSEGMVWQETRGKTFRQYRIGSITKTVTAVAILRLREQGALGLDDRLASHVPDAPYPDVTLKDLLAHRSGLTAEPAGPWWERSPGVSWPALAAANRSAPRVFEPQARYHYSNLGYALLGEVVARHRGMSWYDAVRADVLQPLGLYDTTYLPFQDAAPGTSRDVRTGDLMQEPALDSVAVAPAGQLWSTAADLARWGSFLVQGREGILQAAVLAEMRTVQSADPDTQHLGAYGLGLRLRWRPSSTLVGHTGSMPGFLAAVFTDASSGVGAVVLTNATTGIAPEEVAARLVEAAEPTIVAPGKPQAGADVVGPEFQPASVSNELAGEWFWGNTLMSVEPTPEGFRLHEPHGVRTFTRLEPDVYQGIDGYYAGERLDVLRRSDGSISHLDVVSFVFTRTPYDPDAPIPGGVPAPVNWPDSRSTC